MDELHSSKILMIQQGLPRGVSSVGNPRGPLTGFDSGSVAEQSILHDIFFFFSFLSFKLIVMMLTLRSISIGMIL